jgi:hypothetical protein
LKPNWIENILYYAKALAAKDSKANKQEISKELKEAAEMTPENNADRQAQQEVRLMLKKYGK